MYFLPTRRSRPAQDHLERLDEPSHGPVHQLVTMHGTGKLLQLYNAVCPDFFRQNAQICNIAQNARENAPA